MTKRILRARARKRVNGPRTACTHGPPCEVSIDESREPHDQSENDRGDDDSDDGSRGLLRSWVVRQ
jgi:hypothetical protein